jgi:putative FmdB family regulatory protein
LYEYQCTVCGHRFELIQKFSDKPVKKCPVCGKVVERLVSSPAIQFKGTGWYVTDYGKGGTAPSAKIEPKADQETAKASSSDTAAEKSEAKDTPGPAPASTSKK